MYAKMDSAKSLLYDVALSLRLNIILLRIQYARLPEYTDRNRYQCHNDKTSLENNTQSFGVTCTGIGLCNQCLDGFRIPFYGEEVIILCQFSYLSRDQYRRQYHLQW